MEWIDLHVHSTASDGTLTPTEVVLAAKEVGLSGFALTDHDTIAGIDEAMVVGEQCGVRVIPGIEVSCYLETQDIHILGLNIDRFSKKFLQELQRHREARNVRNQKMLRLMAEQGLDISKEQLEEAFGNAVITRAHLARFLLDTKQVSSMKEAFERYIGQGCPCYLPKEKITHKEALKLIHMAGGRAVLAHPMQYKLSRKQLEALVDELIQVGLEGIEAIYSTHTADDERYLKALAKEKKLIITGGSDFHGSNKPKISIGRGQGKLFVPADLLGSLGSEKK